jgi:hypothetical protein
LKIVYSKKSKCKSFLTLYPINVMKKALIIGLTVLIIVALAIGVFFYSKQKKLLVPEIEQTVELTNKESGITRITLPDTTMPDNYYFSGGILYYHEESNYEGAITEFQINDENENQVNISEFIGGKYFR